MKDMSQIEPRFYFWTLVQVTRREAREHGTDFLVTFDNCAHLQGVLFTKLALQLLHILAGAHTLHPIGIMLSTPLLSYLTGLSPLFLT